MKRNFNTIILYSLGFIFFSICTYFIIYQFRVNQLLLLLSSTGIGLVFVFFAWYILLIVNNIINQEKECMVQSFNENLIKIKKNIYKDSKTEKMYMIIKEEYQLNYCSINLSLSYFNEKGDKINDFNQFPKYEFNSSSLETSSVMVKSYSCNEILETECIEYEEDRSIISPIIGQQESTS